MHTTEGFHSMKIWLDCILEVGLSTWMILCFAYCLSSVTSLSNVVYPIVSSCMSKYTFIFELVSVNITTHGHYIHINMWSNMDHVPATMPPLCCAANRVLTESIKYTQKTRNLYLYYAMLLNDQSNVCQIDNKHIFRDRPWIKTRY